MDLMLLNSGPAGPQPNATQSIWPMLIMIVVTIALMYFVLIRPQKKRQKEEDKMRRNVQVGDEIVTISGLCGRVVSIKEDSLVLETGSDRNKVKIKRWAIQTNETIHEVD